MAITKNQRSFCSLSKVLLITCNFNNLWHKRDVFALVWAKGDTKNTAFYVLLLNNMDVFRNFNTPALTILVYFKIFLCDIWHPPVVTSENAFK